MKTDGLTKGHKQPGAVVIGYIKNTTDDLALALGQKYATCYAEELLFDRFERHRPIRVAEWAQDF